VVNELGEKIGKITSLGGALAIADSGAGATSGAAGGLDGAAVGLFGDAVSALVNLGYARAEAHSAVMRVQAKAGGDNLSDVIAAALREMGT
jgi:Holliday junction DNA helicase RuvA